MGKYKPFSMSQYEYNTKLFAINTQLHEFETDTSAEKNVDYEMSTPAFENYKNDLINISALLESYKKLLQEDVTTIAQFAIKMGVLDTTMGSSLSTSNLRINNYFMNNGIANGAIRTSTTPLGAPYSNEAIEESKTQNVSFNNASMNLNIKRK